MNDPPPPIPDPEQPPEAVDLAMVDLSDAAGIEETLSDSVTFPSRPEVPLPSGRFVVPDPWAHRRGEPRIFAFCWMMYVLFAVAGSIAWVANAGSISATSYSPAARIMLVVVAVGATVLWPMVRLSQQSPNAHRGTVLPHVFADAIIVFTPLQMVTWPLLVLANWPLSIVAAVAATLGVWVALTGGLLALGLAGSTASGPKDPALGSRSTWMCVVLASVLGAPLGMFAMHGAHAPVPSWFAMLSPLTAIPTLAGSGISGPQNRITSPEVEMIMATGVLAVILWIAAAVRSMRGGRRKPA